VEKLLHQMRELRIPFTRRFKRFFRLS
jgi:hypothetical protein